MTPQAKLIKKLKIFLIILVSMLVIFGILATSSLLEYGVSMVMMFTVPVTIAIVAIILYWPRLKAKIEKADEAELESRNKSVARGIRYLIAIIISIIIHSIFRR